MRTIDILGQKFNKLTVLNRIEEQGVKNTRYNCVCECGKRSIVRGTHLRTGRVQSCGCITIARLKAKALPEGESAFHKVLAEYKKRANRKNIAWSLDDMEVKTMMQSFCTYCGEQPNRIARTKSSSFVYNGLDRIDNAKGYTPENTTTACWRCNAAKNNMSLAEFQNWIKRVTEKMGL